MKNYLKNFMMFVFVMFVMGLCLNAVAADIPRMNKDELKGMLDKDDVIVMDVRKGRDWSSSESKIKGAVREEAYQAKTWADKYDKEKTYVLYCA